MRQNLISPDQGLDICTPSANIFPTALLNRCDTYTGLAYDPKITPQESSPVNDIPSPLSGGPSRQATMKLYTANNVY
jgi:hypothetical protein